MRNRNVINVILPAIGVLLAFTLASSSGCNRTPGAVEASPSAAVGVPTASGNFVMTGTALHVTLRNTISSESASALDPWRGTLAEDVETRDGTVIPAGSAVHGVVTGVEAAKLGSRAMLDLSVRGLRRNGEDVPVTADCEPVIAGSTRARNLGAVAGGAVAGAAPGKVAGDGRNAPAGSLPGGAGAVSRTRGYQVVLKAGTVLRFKVGEAVSLH